MFKSAKRTFATVAAVAAATIGLGLASNKADAASGYCYNTNTGGNVCITRVVQTGPNTKRVWSVVDGHYDVDDVYCNPAHRYNYKNNMYGIAFEFS